MTAEKWVYGGESLTRVDGRVVLVPGLIPGERAQIELLAGRKGVARGVSRELIAPSPDRVEPRCPYFYRCGGCHYQHARAEIQPGLKVEILREQLVRVGRLRYDGPIGVVTGPPFGYRNRTQFHLAGGEIGFHGEGSHELVPVEECPVSSPRINETLTSLRGMMRERRWPEFVRRIEIFTNEREVLLNVEGDRPLARSFFEWCERSIPGAGRGWLAYEAAGRSFQVSHNSFFQVNRFLVDDLLRVATEDAGGAAALDLYAGVGLFTLELARRFQSVTAVESGNGAVRDLKTNAEAAGVRLETVRATVEGHLPAITATPDFVLADPPRAGLGPRVTKELARLRAPRLVIVSCDPATLARDLAALNTAGYSIRKLTMVDLFPETYHFETVVSLALD